MEKDFEGFTQGQPTEVIHELGSARAIAHQRLDEIVDWVESGSGGGEFFIQQADGPLYRLTFCDFTGQQKCGKCGGTGVKGSDSTLANFLPPK